MTVRDLPWQPCLSCPCSMFPCLCCVWTYGFVFVWVCHVLLSSCLLVSHCHAPLFSPLFSECRHMSLSFSLCLFECSHLFFMFSAHLYCALVLSVCYSKILCICQCLLACLPILCAIIHSQVVSVLHFLSFPRLIFLCPAGGATGLLLGSAMLLGLICACDIPIVEWWGVPGHRC